MRTRSRTLVLGLSGLPAQNAIQTDIYCSGTPSTTTSNYGVPSFSIVTSACEEVMVDELGRNKPNKCSHRKHTWDIGQTFRQVGPNTIGGRACISDVSPVPWVMQGNEYFRSTYYGWNINTPGQLPSCWTIDASSIDEQKLKDDCIEKANQLKADVLLDLVEANQMWPTIVELATCLPNMARNWRSIRKVLKTASSSYLAYKFGIKPVVSDIMAIQRHLPKLQQDIKRHTEKATARFSKSAECKTFFSGGFHPPGGSLYTHNAIGVALEPPQVRYVLVVKPKNSSYHTDFFKKADYALSRFATSPASLAWELVPFSFVVDWFVDLRSTLRAVDNLVGFEPYEVVSFTRSYGYQLGTEFRTENLSPCNGSGLGLWPAGSCQYRLYERSPVSTSGSYPRWKPRFGKNQAGITAALITQQLSKLH